MLGGPNDTLQTVDCLRDAKRERRAVLRVFGTMSIRSLRGRGADNINTDYLEVVSLIQEVQEAFDFLSWNLGALGYRSVIEEFR